MLKIVDIDRGYKKFLQSVRDLSGTLIVKVGIVNGPHIGSPGLTIADVASFHEFGTPKIPQRSFLRAWADDNRLLILQKLEIFGKEVLFGNFRPRAVLEKLGRWAVLGVKTRIRNNIPPPLAAETVKRKNGNNIALIDSGQLFDSINYRIERK